MSKIQKAIVVAACALVLLVGYGLRKETIVINVPDTITVDGQTYTLDSIEVEVK